MLIVDKGLSDCGVITVINNLCINQWPPSRGREHSVCNKHDPRTGPMIGNKILLASNQTSVAQTLSALALVSLLSGSLGTERIRIQC